MKTMAQIPKCYYRTSIKALVLDSKNRFLLTKDTDGIWDLPGGGLDWGEDPHTCLKREVQEEMNIPIAWIAKNPTYFVACLSGVREKKWIANIIYLVQFKHLNFRPSKECIEAEFFSVKGAKKLDAYTNVLKFLVTYNPESINDRIFKNLREKPL